MCISTHVHFTLAKKMHQKLDITLKEDWSQKCPWQFEDSSKPCPTQKQKSMTMIWKYLNSTKLFISQRGILLEFQMDVHDER